jgi:hypothetical protein
VYYGESFLEIFAHFHCENVIFYGESVLEIFASFAKDKYVRTVLVNTFSGEASENLKNARSLTHRRLRYDINFSPARASREFQSV